MNNKNDINNNNGNNVKDKSIEEYNGINVKNNENYVLNNENNVKDNNTQLNNGNNVSGESAQDIESFIDEVFEKLSLSKSIELNDIPNLDLYMDQVITLFQNNLAHTRRNDDDKLLTKTMINNYTKDKILMNAVKKKYTQNHVLLMIIIYFLKQTMSITDIKTILGPISMDIQNNDSEEANSIDLKKLYEDFLDIKKQNEIKIQNDIKSIMKQDMNEEEKVLFLLRIIDMANGYKRLSEYFIDKL